MMNGERRVVFFGGSRPSGKRQLAEALEKAGWTVLNYLDRPLRGHEQPNILIDEAAVMEELGAKEV